MSVYALSLNLWAFLIDKPGWLISLSVELNEQFVCICKEFSVAYPFSIRHISFLADVTNATRHTTLTVWNHR